MISSDAALEPGRREQAEPVPEGLELDDNTTDLRR
jgi:hypothetical protein